MVGVGSLLVGSLLVGLPPVGLPSVGLPPVGVAVPVGVGADAEGAGVGDCVGTVTGQVNAGVFVYTG